MENSNLLKEELLNNAEIQKYIRQAAGWGKVIAVIGMIASSFLILVALVQTIREAVSGHVFYGNKKDLFTFLIALLGGGTLIFVTSLNLFRFSKKSYHASKGNDQGLFTQSFNHLAAALRTGAIVAIILVLVVIISTLAIYITSQYSRM